MTEALLVGFVLFMAWFLEKIFATPMIARPIVVGPMIGLVLGDLETGVLTGAALEAVFLGSIQIGSAVPPDAMLGAAVGTALAIITNQGPDVAFALGLPVALLGQFVKVISFMVRSWYMDLCCKFARNVEVGKMHFFNWAGLIFQCLIYGGIGFAAIFFGAEATQAAINAVPASIMRALEIAGGLLPAVGFALLVQPMINKGNSMYYFFGFALVAFLKLNVLAVTAFAIVLAFLVVFETKNSDNSTNNNNQEDDELEALFNE